MNDRGAAPLVLGMDVGGSASRAVITTVGGQAVGTGSAGPGNPVTSPMDEAARQVAAALGQALDGTDPARVRAAVLGIAGASGFEDAATAAAFQLVWDRAGLVCPVVPVGDPVVAFAAGTDRPTGTVLIAGTGAAAAGIEHQRMTRVGDGLGWLLGDRGSGFWIGRRAAAMTADRLQCADRSTALTSMIAEAVTGSPETDAESFTFAVYQRAPQALSQLTPLVADAAEGGDRTATAILDEAAGLLASTVAEVREVGRTDPIVLSGSVATRCAPVREGVRRRLTEAWPDAEVALARPAEYGAARIAAGRLREPG